MLFFIYFSARALYILRMFDCLGFCHRHATAIGNSITQELTHRAKCRNWNLESKFVTLVFIALPQGCQLSMTDVSLTLKMSRKKSGLAWNCLMAVIVVAPPPALAFVLDFVFVLTISSDSAESSLLRSSRLTYSRKNRGKSLALSFDVVSSEFFSAFMCLCCCDFQLKPLSWLCRLRLQFALGDN